MAPKETPISTAMDDLLEVAYQPSNSISLLKDLCQKNANSYSTSENYEHYFCIINSSGTGKTKLALELLRSDGFRGIYLLGKNIGNGWASNMLTFIENCPKSDSDDVESYCHRFIDMLTKLIGNTTEFPLNTDLFKAQFSNNLLSQDFMARLVVPPSASVGGKVTPSKSYGDLLHGLNSSSSLSSSSSSSSSLSSSSSSSTASHFVRIIVFDEAEGLIDVGLYAPLQRALSQFPVVGIFLSTNSSIDAPLEKPLQVSVASRRAKMDMLHVPPFVQVCNTDLVINPALLLGRPLWNSQYLYRLGKNMTSLVEYAALKLVGGSFSKDEANYRLQCLSLIGSRYSIQPNLRIGGEFVCKYMATLLQADFVAENIMCRTAYSSEPILAEASAWLMNLSKKEDFLMKTVVQCVSDVFTGADTLVDSSKGDRGEIAMAIAIGSTLDRIRSAKVKVTTYDANQVKSSMSMPISVRDFLNALRSDFTESMLSPFEGYYVNATHFIRYPISVGQGDCCIAVQRMAAFFNKECEANGDNVLPMCKLDENGEMDCGSMRCIRFQVKNLINRPSNNACAKFLDALHPAKCTPQLAQIEEVSISILVLTKAPATVAFKPRLVNLHRPSRNSSTEGYSSESPQRQLQFALELQGCSSDQWIEIQDILPSLARIAGVFAPNGMLSTIELQLGKIIAEQVLSKITVDLPSEKYVEMDEATECGEMEYVSDAVQDEGKDGEDDAPPATKKSRIDDGN